MREGEWVLLKLSQAAKTRSLGRIVQINGFSVEVEIYRLHPERLDRVVVDLGLLRGAAPGSEKLFAAKSLCALRELRARRELAHCTQSRLAEVVGVSRRTIRNAETGRRHTQQQIRAWILEGLRRVEDRSAKGVGICGTR